ncbi:SBBP repeat-containing protein [Corallococcus sp. AS-1-6]|uniref:SBBP repeat-containing protein n=1 Tax=Corallococcus sp. AS-1-6 TaxID=2874599 RepID=UPI001CBF1FB7|nr:SBBP repeat-containing protein [Corallococcus sp. AS-1-6]
MKHLLLSMFGFAGVVGAAGLPSVAAAQVPPPSWVAQLGANLDEQANAVAVSGASVYVVGQTTSQLGVDPKAGGQDAFIARYDTAGNLQWVHQLGTAGADRATAVATDADGNAYVAGITFGGFDFYANAGGFDFFIAKYDTAGNRLWLRQNGTQMDDFVTGIAIGADDTLYFTGYTGGSFANGGNPGHYDILAGLYDTAGNPYWLQQYGSPASDMARGIAVTSSHEVYVVGSTTGSLDGTTPPALSGDMFLLKLNILGVQQWVRQIDAGDLDDARSVAVGPDGGVYIAGETFGGLDGNTNNGTIDVLLARYDSAGNRAWSRLLGGGQPDYAFGVAVTADNVVQVAGYTAGLDGIPSSGSADAFLTRYDALGAKLGTQLLGSVRQDIARGVAVDASGNAYVAGQTGGSLGGNPNAGGNDAFLARF